jgi:hypothetical protein
LSERCCVPDAWPARVPVCAALVCADQVCEGQVCADQGGVAGEARAFVFQQVAPPVVFRIAFPLACQVVFQVVLQAVEVQTVEVQAVEVQPVGLRSPERFPLAFELPRH